MYFTDGEMEVFDEFLSHEQIDLLDYFCFEDMELLHPGRRRDFHIEGVSFELIRVSMGGDVWPYRFFPHVKQVQVIGTNIDIMLFQDNLEDITKSLKISLLASFSHDFFSHSSMFWSRWDFYPFRSWEKNLCTSWFKSQT
jgi:hypothetical protein